MKKRYLFVTGALLTALGAAAQHTPVQPYKGSEGKTLADTRQWWPERAKAAGPNVVWILLDDVGFGAISSFGGLIQTPELDRLAQNGLRYTNFHTTSICAPTRAALLTGRNHHSVHMGLFPENAVGTPGYDAQIPFEQGTVAEILKENGYNTFALGKWHLTPLADLTPAGPFNRWPTGRGFEHFYGFPSRGSTDQWHPELWEDTRREKDQQGRHLNQLLADKAIHYIGAQKSANPDKPFFLYLATGAGHAPHQVAKEWSDRYKGKFDGGWDKYREEVLANQIRLGIVPKNTVLPPRNPGIKAWDSLPADEKKLFARFMEVYAGFLSYTDYEVGRVVRYLEEIGQLDNTLIFVSVGDNGASKEGTFVGVVNNYGTDLSEEERLRRNIADIDLIGTEYAKANYPLGWAAATNTPFRQWKQDANTEGGTRNPLIVHYPARIREKGGIRKQYSHVNDLLPTTLELVGAQIPASINGYPQQPLEGTSLAYSIDNASAKDRHTLQYYEILGTRSVYKDGWKAGTLHVKGQDFTQDKWELHHIEEDFNELHDLAAAQPQKLAELRGVFEAEAAKRHIYPLKDGTIPTFGPTAYKDRQTLTLYPGGSTIVDIANPLAGKKAFRIAADVEIPSHGAEGVLLSRGGRAGGLSFFVKDKALYFAYNVGDGGTFVVRADQPLAPGRQSVQAELVPDGKGGTLSLSANGKPLGSRVLPRLYGNLYLHEGLNLGFDDLTPVTDAYVVPFAFTGTLHKVTIDLPSPEQKGK
ncbi:arylsulfatase [Siphonobacter aquaeclarae]|uniref:Arylsulfatase n=1 Tax=Siphonobacter aquaeclarae TaxID=563176 RepID=A0A1G9HFD6_9BACT|nr:arylsulfatase [Siphonobacter aquaeclarae]SDL11728.1 arylsulfatase [Siphonobacter aquaeclarae]